MTLTLNHYLLVSGLLFAIGFAGVLLRRNIIIIFMCLELMLNAANLSLVAFSRFSVETEATQTATLQVLKEESAKSPQASSLKARIATLENDLAKKKSHGLPNFNGQVLVFFIITVAAAEVAVGLAIIVALFRARQTTHVEDISSLKF